MKAINDGVAMEKAVMKAKEMINKGRLYFHSIMSNFNSTFHYHECIISIEVLYRTIKHEAAWCNDFAKSYELFL